MSWNLLLNAITSLGPPGLFVVAFIVLSKRWTEWMEDPERLPETHLDDLKLHLAKVPLGAFDRLRQDRLHKQIDLGKSSRRDSFRVVTGEVDEDMRRIRADTEISRFERDWMQIDTEIADTARDYIVSSINTGVETSLDRGLSRALGSLKAFYQLRRRRIRTNWLHRVSLWLLILGGITWMLHATGYPWTVAHRLPEITHWLLPAAVIAALALFGCLATWFSDIEAPLPERILREESQ